MMWLLISLQMGFEGTLLQKAIGSCENASLTLCEDWNLVWNQITDIKNNVQENNVKAQKEVQRMCDV